MSQDADDLDAEFLRRAIEGACLAILETDSNSRIVRANRHAALLFGFPDVATMRRETDGVLTQIHASPADHKAKMDELDRAGEIRERIWEAKKRNGGRVWVRESAVRVPGDPPRHIGTLTDVTALVEAWAEVRRAEASYRSLFDNAAQGMYRSSPEGKQLRANPALVALNGHETEAEMLAAVTDIGAEWYVAPGRRDEFKRQVETEGRVRNFESEIYRHKTRERIWVSESAWVVRGQDGRVLYYEGVIEDVTERKRVEVAFVAAKAEAERLADEYRSIYDNANLGIYRTALDGRVERISLGMARLNGFRTVEENFGSIQAPAIGGSSNG
jgi:PAS domain S-box-containing protein